jgi:CheY-like chemotaxis protein
MSAIHDPISRPGGKRTRVQKDAMRDASEVASEPINILIVDDEPKNLLVLRAILDDPAYRLVQAHSADEALLALIAEEFALLILDVRMPGMTGFELA